MWPSIKCGSWGPELILTTVPSERVPSTGPNQRSCGLDPGGLTQLITSIQGDGHILVKRNLPPSHLDVAKDLDRGGMGVPVRQGGGVMVKASIALKEDSLNRQADLRTVGPDPSSRLAIWSRPSKRRSLI